MRKQVYKTHSSEETKELAAKLVSDFFPEYTVIALYADLGGGKTTFAQGMAKALGIEKPITSPTFLVMKTYENAIKEEKSKKKHFYHVDLYRTDNSKDIENVGVIDMIQDPDNIVIVEWAEKMKEMLPKKRVDIYVRYIDEETREITVDFL